MKSNSIQSDVIGLIPAAGRASRLAPLPCSKEIYPVGFHAAGNNNNFRPKAVSHYLLEKMRLANITKAYIILRDNKWDIPSYFGDGNTLLDMHLAYLIMNLPYGVPYTLDQAYPFVQNSMVALGFPDIMFQPENAYSQLLARQQASGADVVLGIFPATQPHKTDMVMLDNKSNVISLDIKPERTELIYTWQIAVWTPNFTRFMHEYVSSGHGAVNAFKSGDTNETKNELFVGDVIQAALQTHIEIDSVIFEDGTYLDIGTPDDLIKAVQICSEVSKKV